MHVRKSLAIQIDVAAKLSQHFAGFRASHVYRGPAARDIRDDDLELRPLALQPFFKPRRDAGCAAAGAVDPELFRRNARAHAVVNDDALLVEHEAIANAAGLQRVHAVGVHAIEELGGIGAAHREFAERRGVVEVQRQYARLALSRWVAL